MDDKDKEIASLRAIIALQSRKIEIFYREIENLKKRAAPSSAALLRAYGFDENPETD